MVEHVFGGDWTRKKLDRLQAYLIAYRQIFDKNPAARFLTTWYVDAFAGTGSHSLVGPSSVQTLSLMDGGDWDEEQGRFLEGSARIALGLTSPFDNYLFIEKNREKADTLQSMIDSEFPALASRVRVRVGDANEELRKWCNSRNWSKERAVVFLDPFGMQVEWDTVQSLAGTKAVDLWYLFPFSVIRLLTRNPDIDEKWARRLDTLFGTPEWRTRFYRIKTQPGLFGEQESLDRDVTESNVKEFVEERLKTIFLYVARSRVFHNTKNSPQFTFCFASFKTSALNIAQYLLEN